MYSRDSLQRRINTNATQINEAEQEMSHLQDGDLGMFQYAFDLVLLYSSQPLTLLSSGTKTGNVDSRSISKQQQQPGAVFQVEYL